MSQFEEHFEEKQLHIEGRVINGQAFLQFHFPADDGWISLEDAQHIVNMLQAAIDAGKHEESKFGGRN